MPSKNARVVKLKEAVFEKLLAWVSRQEKHADTIQEIPWWGEDGLSFSAAIARLIDLYERGQRRKAKSRAKRRAKEKEEKLEYIVFPCGWTQPTPAERFFGFRPEEA